MKTLVIDDDLEIRAMASMLLAQFGGYEVIEARNGREGIEKARAEKPELILLDVSMPEMDGPAVLTHLLADDATRHIPVIFVTAHSEPEDVTRYIALGARGVVGKPFNPLTLHEDIARILE